MIFAIDIGNTNITVGCSNGTEISFTEHLSTNQTATSLEYAVLLKSVLEIHKVEEISGAVISSVVPTITETLCRAVEKICGIRPLVVDSGIINLRTLEPSSNIGTDLLSSARGLIEEYPLPAVVIDMGTATTLAVVNSEKEFIGGMIMSGFRISLDSLVSNTSLPKISIEKPKRFIGRNTVECMQSGLIYGTASCIDGMLERIESEINQKITAVATGSFAEFIVPYCRHNILVDNELVLKGLVIIYNNNKKILL
ncbi:MAG TPA: pantothenate kinase [Ruminococcus sp.]|nr:pantothenate kinase [Ruminococcus sp.]